MVEVMQALFSVLVHTPQPVGRQLPSWPVGAQLAPLIWIRLQPLAPVAAAAGEAMLPSDHRGGPCHRARDDAASYQCSTIDRCRRVRHKALRCLRNATATGPVQWIGARFGCRALTSSISSVAASRL